MFPLQLNFSEAIIRLTVHCHKFRFHKFTFTWFEQFSNVAEIGHRLTTGLLTLTYLTFHPLSGSVPIDHKHIGTLMKFTKIVKFMRSEMSNQLSFTCYRIQCQSDIESQDRSPNENQMGIQKKKMYGINAKT